MALDDFYNSEDGRQDTGQDGRRYTAWDGQQYEGSPPGGWFLAADNRWWPSQEMIEHDEDHPNDHPDNGLDESPHDGQGSQAPQESQQTPQQHRQPNPSPPASWAPESGGSGYTEIEPQPAGNRGASASSGQPSGTQVPTTGRRRGRAGGRGRKFPIWRLVIFVFFLSRCGVLGDIGDAISNDGDSDGESTVIVEGSIDGYTFDTSCSPGLLSGSITNQSETMERFLVKTVRFDGGREYEAGPLFVRPSETRSWTIDFVAIAEPEGFCPSIEVSIAP